MLSFGYLHVARPLLSFGPSFIVPGPAYPLALPFGCECLTSLPDCMSYYDRC